MKNKIISIFLALTLTCSSAIILANADSIKLGDVNKDDKITASDARLVLRASAQIESLSEEAKLAADVTFDKKITASDARLILRASAQIEELPEMPTQETPSESTTDESTTNQEPEKPSEKPSEDPSENTTEVIAETYPAAIDAFFSGKYYLEAIAGEGNDTTTMKIAISEKGYAFSTELALFEDKDPMELSIMQLAKTLYIKYNDVNGKKKVFALDEKTMASMKESLGLDLSEMLDSSIFDELNLSFKPLNEKPFYSKGEYKGEECDVYTFNLEEGKIAFYAIGEDVKTINIIDAEGNEGTAMEIIKLTGRIPGQILSTQGCTQVEFLGFVADLMALMPEDA